MPEERKIDYIEMPSRDLKATQAFFNALFGWEFTDYGPDYTDFNDGRISGGFYKSDRAMHADEGSALVVFYSEKLDKMPELIVRLGGQISKPIFSFPGGRRFHFSDPGGSEFAIWSDK